MRRRRKRFTQGKDGERRCTVRFTVRVTEEEWQLLEERLPRAGMQHPEDLLWNEVTSFLEEYLYKLKKDPR